MDPNGLSCVEINLLWLDINLLGTHALFVPDPSALYPGLHVHLYVVSLHMAFRSLHCLLLSKFCPHLSQSSSILRSEMETLNPFKRINYPWIPGIPDMWFVLIGNTSDAFLQGITKLLSVSNRNGHGNKTSQFIISPLRRIPRPSYLMIKKATWVLLLKAPN